MKIHSLHTSTFSRKEPFTAGALVLISLTILCYFFIYLDHGNAISWDAFGYYYYLPLVFIQKSLMIENFELLKGIFESYNPSSTIYQFNHLPNGQIIIRYTCGQAVLYAPFFLLGHLIALTGSFPPDGFSAPYEVCARIGSVVYNILAFYILARVLRQFFDDKIVMLTLLLLFFGTNAFMHLNGHALSAQGSLFFLFALFIFLIHNFYLNKSAVQAVLAGLTFGLICISRPTDGIIIVPAILWPLMLPGKDLSTEIRVIFIKHKRSVIYFLTGTLAMVSLQLLYWKIAGSEWIIDSYGNPAEGLDFLSPHTIPFLFSFRTGWFIYTPLMILVVLFMFRNVLIKPQIQIPIFVFFILFLYIVSSWTNYWYGGSFSQRAMVEAYVFLAFPLASLLVWLRITKSWARKLIVGGFVFFVVLNIWQATQYRRGVFQSRTMTSAYYMASFFDLERDPAKAHLLSIDRDKYYLSMENTVPPGYIKINSYPASLKADTIQMEGLEFPAEFRMAYRDFCPYDHCWVGFNVFFQSVPEEGTLLVTTISRQEGNYRYQTREAKECITEESADGIFTATSFYLTPEMRSDKDDLHVYIWNRGLANGILTGMRIDVYAQESSIPE